MYNSFFGFTQSPFASVPLAQHYFPAAAIESARGKLARCVERGEGIALVVGRSGLGKTLLCHVLSEGFRSRFQVVPLAAGRLSTRRSLFQALLYSLGKPYRGMDDGDLRLSLVDCLNDVQQYPNGVILLVDDADVLPLRLLDEIRLFMNLSAEGRPRLRPILSGACRLEERLNSPRLESLNQRIVARCYLEPFTQAETQQYIHTRIKAVGGAAEELFPAEACRSIHVATDGVPRLINQLCDHVLLLAYVNGKRRIEPALVEEAWQDLQQLPVPISRSDAPCHDSAGVIEFGQLEDLPDAPDHRRPETEPLALRVVSEAACGTEAEPAVRLAAVESMVEQLDDEFQPAGTIKPEVDLFFGDDEFPLAQRFEEEELVEVRACRPAHARPGATEKHLGAEGAGLVGEDVVSEQRNESAEPFPQTRLLAADAAQSSAAPDDTSVRQTAYEEPVAGRSERRSAERIDDAPEGATALAQCLHCMGAAQGGWLACTQADSFVQYMPAPATCSIVPLRQRRFGRLFATLKWG